MSGKKAAPADRKTATASPKAQSRTAKGTSPHVDAAAGTELARNALSRQRYEFVMKITSGFVILAILLSVFIVYLATRPVEYRYFTTDSRGGIREISALNRPIQTDEEVLNWATSAVTKAYSMSFANYGQQLNDLKIRFTDAGWRGYEQALERSGFLDSLLKNQYVTSAVPKQAPVVVAKGTVNGVYGWRLQIPVIVTFTSASNSSSQDINVEVTVVRRDESENPSGLGIAQILSQ